MQKILYVFGGEKASGAEIVIDRLIRHNNIEAHLFISPGTFADRLLKEAPYTIVTSVYLKKLNRATTGAFAFFIKAFKSYVAISFKVLKYIPKNNIEAVHANTVVPASYIIPALLISKIFYPHVKWLWSDHDLQYSSKKDNWFSHLNIKFYDITLAVSKAVKFKYKGNKHYNKVAVLYNGLDIEKFKKDEVLRAMFRVNHNISEGTVLIGIAGILSARKGQKELLEVFLELTKQFNNIFLVLAGNVTIEDHTYGKEVIEIAKKNPATVKYLGAVNDMLSFYNGCDIIISNSNRAGSEPLGTTIYEAMACEKTVIASNTGGTSEIIDDELNGLIFEAQNKKELIKKIRHCITNPADYTYINSNARTKVINNFNVVKMASLYNRILADKIWQQV